MPDTNPFRGRPLELRPLPFTLTMEEKMRGAMGVPSWVRRRRKLEISMEQLRTDLDRRWSLTATEDWTAIAQAWDLSPINREIERFNRFYPIERNLPLDPRTRKMFDGGVAWMPLPALDAAWILDAFPADGAGRKR